MRARLKQYQNWIRRFRDYGPTPDVREAFETGYMRGPLRWNRGTKQAAAHAAGRIVKGGEEREQA